MIHLPKVEIIEALEVIVTCIHSAHLQRRQFNLLQPSQLLVTQVQQWLALCLYLFSLQSDEGSNLLLAQHRIIISEWKLVIPNSCMEVSYAGL